MASKRKSTVPCMIPSKSKHLREEVILGSLPELLPTIPEDSILSISGEESGHFPHSAGSGAQKGGTYGCAACRFESRDLNYFLDHMHNCHVDFRAQPTFYCRDCRVSVVRFEALALHNANAHPRIMEGVVTASLSVSQRDGVTAVEQSLFTDGSDDCRDAGGSLTKTPMAKMTKAKAEHKKIVVSHTVEVRRLDTGKEGDPGVVADVPELQNGALGASGTPPVPRTAISHVITTVSNQLFHQHTPSLYSPSSDSNKDLPKVMIPLSSIPTYDAAMDTSSFLKTSFGKFPYPTKAELCYLTVVSEFPEEQIKLWFTAQRLKQGISWSPEEIEEARRKMFNTVFQGGAPQKQPAVPRPLKHIVSHHTIAAHPKGPNFRMAKVPPGTTKLPPGGVIAAQASMSTNPNVPRVSYSTAVISPQFPPVVTATERTSQSSDATVEPNGVDVAGDGSTGTHSGRSCSDSTDSVGTGNLLDRTSPTNSDDGGVAGTAGISRNHEHCPSDANGKLATKGDSLLLGPTGAAGPAIVTNTCNSLNSGSTGAAEPDSAEKPVGENQSGHDSDDSCTATERVPERPCSTENSSGPGVTRSSSSIVDEEKSQDCPLRGTSILQQLIKEEDLVVEGQVCPDLRTNPVKISFKRLKRSDPDTTPEAKHEEHPSEMDTCQPPIMPPWGNKTPQQLHVLRQAFSSTRWPSSAQYEDLSIWTGLPKSEVVRWFSDSRYSHKTGQLRWLETYQRSSAESEDTRSPGEAESPPGPLAAKRKPEEPDTNKHLEVEAGLTSGQRTARQDSWSPGSAERAKESAQPGASQGPWLQGRGDQQQPADVGQDRDGLRMELLEV